MSKINKNNSIIDHVVAIDKEFQAILENRIDGSTQILLLLIEFINENWEEFTANDCRSYVHTIADNFPDMMVLSRLSKNIENNTKNQIKEIFTWHSTQIRHSIEIIVEKFNKIIKGNKMNVLTFSNSYTIENVILKSYLDSINNIYVYESNPGGEGKILAERLMRDHQIKDRIKLVSDRDGDRLIQEKEVDLIIIGCDAYTKDRWFINKIGSNTIVKLAKTNNVKIVVLTSKSKEVEKCEISNILSPILEYVKLEKYIIFLTD